MSAPALLAPASALATPPPPRYAAPSGTGSACTAAAPCDIVTAVNMALAGEEVVVGSGSYGSPVSPITTTLHADGGQLVHGAAGQPRPVIYSSAGVGLDAANVSTVSGLAIYDSSGEAVRAAGSTVDHSLAVSAAGGGTGCGGSGGATLIDSVCEGATGAVFGAGCAGTCTNTETLRNDTIVGPVEGLVVDPGSGDQEIVNATNTIVRGGVFTTEAHGGTATANLDHSNYASVDTSAGGTATPAGTGTNQTASPGFVNAAGGDYREAAGSPTIDAGVTNTLNGTTDVDGNLRAIGASTDIGAYEFAAPILTPVIISQIGPTFATASATISNGAAGAANYRLIYGTSTSYSSSTVLGSAAQNASPQPVTLMLTGLTPGTTFHYRLVATSPGGVAVSADGTFETLALPILSAFRLSRAHPRAGHPVKLIYRDSAPAQTTLRIYRLVYGTQQLLRTLTMLDHVGANSVTLRPRAGRYVIVASAVLDGSAGGAVTFRYRVR